MKHDQKGFGIVEIMVVIILILSIAAAGIYVYSSRGTKQSTNNNQTHTPTTPDSQKSSVDNPGQQQARQVQLSQNKNPGFITISEWGIAARIGDTANSDSITYRIAKDEYGDDTAYFQLKENISASCREIGLALHRKTTSENSKYTKIGQAYYAPSAAPMSTCDKSSNQEKAIALLNNLSRSIDNYDFEFKQSN